jgi:hypothetical protein
MLDGNASYPLTSFARPHADDTRQEAAAKCHAHPDRPA